MMFQYPQLILVMKESAAFPKMRILGMLCTDSSLKNRLPFV